jgi:PAS domain-containing protein
MPASGWMRKWTTVHSSEERAGALVRAAARGDSLDHLLELGAQTLLATGAADRADLWLTGEGRGGLGRGRVVEAALGPIPEQWKHLDVSTPFLQAVLESPEPLRAEFGLEETMPRLGPLVGMHGAIWIPLRARNCTFGLAMVAYDRARAAVGLDLETLRLRADEIALAVAHYRNTRRSELAAEGLRSQVRLSRAILCGVSVDSILPQIARAARHHVQAEFVALGKAGGSPMLPEGWDGPDECRTLLPQEPLLHIWHTVLEQGREVEIGGEALPARPGSASDHALPALDRVITFPIEIGNRTCGVLMAGLLPSEDSNDDMVALESYALLAASALDREATRGMYAEWVNSLQRIVEESNECLVVVDEKGRVREASRAARSFLHLDSGCAQGILLEDFFPPAARNAVAEWRKRFIRHDSELTSGAKRPVVPLEAALAAGAAVRLHLRSAIDARGDEIRRWLIYVEDHGSRKALREAEGRLEAEMHGLMDSIDSGVLLLDAAGNIRVVSDRLAQIMGLEARKPVRTGHDRRADRKSRGPVQPSSRDGGALARARTPGG